ncbi:MAG: hypothetical protein DDT19_00246 [Syntrophomonadaceae bacterium]|nr:hypothetical protein [Bacillota bacterium]
MGPEVVQEPGAPELGAQQVGPEPQAPETFSREYVESLRKEAAAHRTKAKELERNLKELEASLETTVEEKAKEYLQQLYQQYYGQNPYQQNPYQTPYYDQTAQKLTELEKRYAALEQRLGATLPKVHEQELEKMLASLKGKYPLMREKELLAEILAYGDSLTPDEIDEVAKVSHEEMTSLRDRYITEYLESKKKPAPPLSQTRAPLGSPSMKPEEMGWEDVHKAAVEYLKEGGE